MNRLCGISPHLSNGDILCKPEWTPITAVSFMTIFKYIREKFKNIFCELLTIFVSY
jgi:hypothetical protein